MDRSGPGPEAIRLGGMGHRAPHFPVRAGVTLVDRSQEEVLVIEQPSRTYRKTDGSTCILSIDQNYSITQSRMQSILDRGRYFGHWRTWVVGSYGRSRLLGLIEVFQQVPGQGSGIVHSGDLVLPPELAAFDASNSSKTPGRATRRAGDGSPIPGIRWA